MFQSPKNLPIEDDYVGNPYNSAKFGAHPSMGAASAQMGEI